MTTLLDLLVEKAALDKKISEAREHEIHDVIVKIRTIVNDFGLQEADVFGGKRAARKTVKGTGGAPAKYQNPSTGETWSGRGRPPRWILDTKNN